MQRLGMERRGMARLGSDWKAMARPAMTRLDPQSRGEAPIGVHSSGKARCVPDCPGLARHGMVGRGGQGLDKVGQGKAI